MYHNSKKIRNSDLLNQKSLEQDIVSAFVLKISIILAISDFNTSSKVTNSEAKSLHKFDIRVRVDYATVAQQHSDDHHKESLHLYYYLTKHSD
jgi:hypothetical protein